MQRPGAEAALTGQIIVRYANKDVSTSVAGIDPDKEKFLTQVESDMLKGSLDRLPTTADGVVIGSGMSDTLGLLELVSMVKFTVPGMTKQRHA